MKTVIMLAPNLTDATSFYRAAGPMIELSKLMGFRLQMAAEINWATLKMGDIIMLQRPFTDSHVKIVDMAKTNGLPVWVDYDDDLFSVPKSNKTHKLYGNPVHQNNIAQIIAKADAVSVSTEMLKEKFVTILDLVKKGAPDYEGLNLDTEKIMVIPNAYDDGFVKAHRSKGKLKPHQNKLITWRGSDTHDKDLMEFTPQIKNCISRHLDWTFNFVGNPFWWSLEQFEQIPGIKETNVIVSDPLDPAEYWKMLWMTAPALVIVPLWDCPFNRAKSNIAWIEALHAGALTLAPDWPEWRRPGVINYSSPQDFEEKLDRFMRGEYEYEETYAQAWKFLKEKLTLEKVNHLRAGILIDLWSDKWREEN